jgi:hypothetical protein
MTNYLLKNVFDFIYKYYILVFEFDKNFYLACNPDVKETGINPISHFIKNGFGEKRIFSLKGCDTEPLDYSKLIGYQDFFNLTSKDLVSNSFHFSIVLLPWSPGCWGRPFKFIRVRITNSLVEPNIFKDPKIVLYNEKGFCESQYLLKY